jgi:hypothetical protein
MYEMYGEQKGEKIWRQKIVTDVDGYLEINGINFTVTAYARVRSISLKAGTEVTASQCRVI